MSYWEQVIYILAVADVMGFIMLAILFCRMSHDYGWMLAFLFATSAAINITGTMAIAHTMPDHFTTFTTFTLSCGVSRSIRIFAQLLLVLKLTGIYRGKDEERSDV